MSLLPGPSPGVPGREAGVGEPTRPMLDSDWRCVSRDGVPKTAWCELGGEDVCAFGEPKPAYLRCVSVSEKTAWLCDDWSFIAVEPVWRMAEPVSRLLRSADRVSAAAGGERKPGKD